MISYKIVLVLLLSVSWYSSVDALSPLTISNGAGDEVTVTESTPVLDYPGFTTAESSGFTFWFTYTEEDYDDKMENANRPTLVFRSQAQLPSIKSAQGFDFSLAPEVILFPHYLWRGEAVSLTASNLDITQLFPPGRVHGLSSIWTFGGQWEFYTDINFEGERVIILGTEVPEEFNDSVKSIKLL